MTVKNVNAGTSPPRRQHTHPKPFGSSFPSFFVSACALTHQVIQTERKTLLRHPQQWKNKERSLVMEMRADKRSSTGGSLLRTTVNRNDSSTHSVQFSVSHENTQLDSGYGLTRAQTHAAFYTLIRLANSSPDMCRLSISFTHILTQLLLHTLLYVEGDGLDVHDLVRSCAHTCLCVRAHLVLTHFNSNHNRRERLFLD